MYCDWRSEINKTKVVLWRALHVVTIIALVLALFPVPAGAIQRPAPAKQAHPSGEDAAIKTLPEAAADAPVLFESTPPADGESAPPAPPAPPPSSPMVGPNGGVVRSADGRVVLSFPRGAVERTVTVAVTPQTRDAKTPAHLFHVFTVQALDDLGAAVTRFAQPVLATVIFRSIDLDGLQGSPAIFWLNDKGEWVALGSQVDWGQGMVTVSIDHFSTFAAGVTTLLSYGAQDLRTVHGFTSDDWSGNSSIHYPLNLPPGPGKLGLSLSLDYSSENVNGIRAGAEYDGGTNLDQQRANEFNRQASSVGWGWNLGGLGAIVNTLPAGSNKTYLNAPGMSVELTSTLGNGWQTDPQTFASVSHGADKFNSDPWIVRTTDGMTYTFGSASWGNGMAWNINDNGCYRVLREAYLTEVRDAYANRAVITYANETRSLAVCTSDAYVRAVRPTRIEYFAKGEALSTVRVDFGYSTRSDTHVVGYNNGYAEVYWSDYRLTSITVKVRNGTLDSNFATARTYQLNHDYLHNGDSTVSIMTLLYIRQLGTAGAQLPDWTFTYQKFYGWLNFVLLQTANNGQGGSVAYSYEDVGNIWVEGCGTNTRRWRVSQQDIGDGMGNTLRTVFVSQNPWAVSGAVFPQCPNFEFAGYGNVERQVKDGANTVYQATSNAFHQRNGNSIDARKGKVYQAQTKDGVGGAVIAQSDTTWTSATERETTWVYKADETAWAGNSNTAHTTRYFYTSDHQNGAQFGNLTHVKESLDTTTTVYRTQETWYYPNTTAGANYIVNRPARQILLDGDVGGVCKSDIRYLYDGNTGYNQLPVKGDVTKTRLATDTCGDGAVFSDSQAAYDSYGNQTSVTDPKGNVTTTVYDTTGGWTKLFALPTSVTQPPVGGVTFTSIYAWNKTIAQVTQVTDPNAAITTYQYDQWARQVKLWKPGDSTAGAATAVFTYTNYVNSTAPFRVQQAQCDSRTTCSATSYLDSVTFYDGVGRVIQTQAEAAVTNQSILVNSRYNPLGKVISQTVPYGYSGAALTYRTPDWNQPTTHYAYDMMGRPTLAINPDGTDVRSYYNYPGSGRSQAAAIDPMDHMTLQESDVLGRLKEARQYLGIYSGLPVWSDPSDATATYGYDVADRLTSTNDPIGAQTTINYDAAGRKTSMSDQDMGAWSYGYDAAANLTRQTDARNQTICFYYDAQNRLKGKVYWPSPCPADSGVYDVKYTYDQGTNGKGQRTRMDDQSGNTQWTFDARGRMTQETKLISGAGTFVSKWAYDPADRVISSTYPKNNSGVTGERVDTYYNNAGLVSSVRGMTDTMNYAAGITYNALSRPITTTLGNGTSMTWGYWGVGGDYDSGPAVGLTSYGALWRIRAATSVGEPRFDIRYSYDGAGNIQRAAEAPRAGANWPTTYTFQDDFNSLDTNNWTFSSYQTIVSDGGNNVLRSQGPGAWTSYFYRGNSGGSGYVLTSGEGMQVRLKVSADNTMAHVSIEANDPTYRRFGVVHRGKRLSVQYFDNGTGVARYPADIISNVELNVWYVVRIVLDDSARGFYVEAFKESAPLTVRGSYSTRMPGGLSWRFIHYIYTGYAYYDAYREFSTSGMTWSPDVRHSYIYDGLNRLIDVQPFENGQGYYGTYGYDAAGRFTFKNDGNGWGTYAYGDANHKHAVTTVGSPQNWSFAYDQTGNMTTRNLGATSYGLSYDAENRLSSVSGSGSATFVYDGDGKRVKATIGGVTTAYIGAYFEWDSATSTSRSYYYAGSLRIATRLGTALPNYLLGDNLGSTSMTLDNSQAVLAETRYKVYGEEYTTSGSQPTTFRFTGQRLDAGIQLYFYNARYYDHIVGRFVQADSIVPQPGNPQSLNRYSYVLNNPLRYSDPSGHDPLSQEWRDAFRAAHGRDPNADDEQIRLFSYAYPDEWDYDAFYGADGQVREGSLARIFHNASATRSWNTMSAALLRLSARYTPTEESAFARDIGLLWAGLASRSENTGRTPWWYGAIHVALWIQEGGMDHALSRTTINEADDPDANVHHWAWGFAMGGNLNPILAHAANWNHEYMQGQGGVLRRLDDADRQIGGRGIQMAYALRANNNITYADLPSLFRQWLGLGD